MSLAGKSRRNSASHLPVSTTTETRVITAAQLPLRLRELKDWPTLTDYLAGQEK